MKKLLFFWLAMICLSLCSCDENDAVIVQDTSDYKAEMMAGIGTLFETVARQPELASAMIDFTVQYHYASFVDLLPLTDKRIAERGKARGEALGLMFESLARQPDMLDVLDTQIAEVFLGVYNSEYISEALNDAAKAAAYPSIVESVARQPAIFDDIRALLVKYFNVTVVKTSENEVSFSSGY